MDGERAEFDDDVVVFRDDEVGDREEADPTGVDVDGEDKVGGTYFIVVTSYEATYGLANSFVVCVER